MNRLYKIKLHFDWIDPPREELSEIGSKLGINPVKLPPPYAPERSDGTREDFILEYETKDKQKANQLVAEVEDLPSFKYVEFESSLI